MNSNPSPGRDKSGRNSPFTTALVRHIASTSDDLGAILINVRNEVMRETRGGQIPWDHSSLLGRFYFNEAARSADDKSAAVLRSEAARAEWERVRNSTSTDEVKAFIAKYNGTAPLAAYLRVASVRIALDIVGAEKPGPSADDEDLNTELAQQAHVEFSVLRH